MNSFAKSWLSETVLPSPTGGGTHQLAEIFLYAWGESVILYEICKFLSIKRDRSTFHTSLPSIRSAFMIISNFFISLKLEIPELDCGIFLHERILFDILHHIRA